MTYQCDVIAMKVNKCICSDSEILVRITSLSFLKDTLLPSNQETGMCHCLTRMYHMLWYGSYFDKFGVICGSNSIVRYCCQFSAKNSPGATSAKPVRQDIRPPARKNTRPTEGHPGGTLSFWRGRRGIFGHPLTSRMVDF